MDNFLISVYNSGNYSLHDQEFNVNLRPNTVNITSPTTTTIAGYPAKEIRASFLNKGTGQNLTADDIMTVINHRKYELILYSEPSTHDIYLPTIQHMINSFRILNFTLYHNPNLEFQMSFPSDWKIREDIDKVKFSSSPENHSDIFREYLAVRSPVILSGNYTRDTYLDQLISNLKQLRENLSINRTNSVLDITFWYVTI